MENYGKENCITKKRNVVIPNEILEIKKSILQNKEVEQIYLFGSYANGTNSIDSDFDFYVVIKDNTLRPLDVMEKIGLQIYSIQTKPVDLIVNSKSVFNMRKELPTIERTIFTRGTKIYG